MSRTAIKVLFLTEHIRISLYLDQNSPLVVVNEVSTPFQWVILKFSSGFRCSAAGGRSFQKSSQLSQLHTPQLRAPEKTELGSRWMFHILQWPRPFLPSDRVTNSMKRYRCTWLDFADLETHQDANDLIQTFETYLIQLPQSYLW